MSHHASPQNQDIAHEEILRAYPSKLRGGYAPLGYRKFTEDGTTCILFDEPRASLIRQAFMQFASGEATFTEAHARVTEQGLVGRDNKPLSPAQLLHILKNPYYTGIMKERTGWKKGIQYALVTQDVFDAVQRRLIGFRFGEDRRLEDLK
jgi:site-specific DNA recombinase